MRYPELYAHLVKLGAINNEIRVAELVTMGLSNAEIANQLFVTERTVKRHLEALYRKAGVRGRVGLIVQCLPFTPYQTRAAGGAK